MRGEPVLPIAIRLLAAADAGLPPSLELAATLYLPSDTSGPAPGLIVGHGAGSRRARHEAFCLEASRQGFVVLALDFRGHGDSGGTGDGPLEQDVLAAARFLHEHPSVDPARVCYRGSSLGGFYGLKAAREAQFAALVLLCPASEDVILNALPDGDDTETEDTADVHSEAATGAMTRWDLSLLRAYFARQDSRALAALVTCPVLLVHARGDEVVPLAHSLALAEALQTETVLLALSGGTHTTAQHDPAVHRYTIAWLRDKLTSACTART